MSQLFLCLLLLAFAAARADTAVAAAGAQDGAGEVRSAPTPAATAARPGALQVDVKRSDIDGQHVYQVTASGTVLAPPAAVWKVLTTYDRMQEFVPDLASCKVIARNGNEAIVEQFGHARFLFVTKAIHLIVRATETPQSSIDIALISGDMKQYEARWELQLVPETGGTRVLYSGKLMPDFYVPGLLGASMVRADIRHMMAAVLTRLDSQRDNAAARADDTAATPATGPLVVPVPMPATVNKPGPFGQPPATVPAVPPAASGAASPAR